MPQIIADRVKETSSTTGVGAFTLAGAAQGYRAFSALLSIGDTCYYTIEALTAAGAPSGEWETGLGTYSALNTLTRTTVLSSSNAGAAVNFAAGLKNVMLDAPAHEFTTRIPGLITAAMAAVVASLGTAAAADIGDFAAAAHTHTFASITSKPTTVSGYGITDALVVNAAASVSTLTASGIIIGSAFMFAAQNDAGWTRQYSNQITYTAAGTNWFRIATNTVCLGNISFTGSGSDATILSSLMADGAGILSQRNSTNAQTLRVYTTYTDSSNGRWLELGDWSGNNGVRLFATGNGTGVNPNLMIGTAGFNPIYFFTNNTNRWTIDGSGHLAAAAAYNITTTGNIVNASHYAPGATLSFGVNGGATSWQINAGNLIPHVFDATFNIGSATQRVQNLYLSGGVIFGSTAGNYVTIGDLLANVQGVMTINVQNGTSGYGGIGTFTGNNNGVAMGFGGLTLGSAALVRWTSSTPAGSTDLVLLRGGAGILEQRNSTNAQTFHVYNTYTDASNYERASIWWDSSILKIGTFKAGTGATRIFGLYAGGIRQIVSDGSYVQIDTETYFMSNLIGAAKFQEWAEMTAPAAPAANKVRIYAEDDGAGKTRLMALFSSGAAQQLAIQP
ncbi:MAG: hypothetical protein WA045_14320 [Nitrospira sp.]